MNDDNTLLNPLTLNSDVKQLWFLEVSPPFPSSKLFNSPFCFCLITSLQFHTLPLHQAKNHRAPSPCHATNHSHPVPSSRNHPRPTNTDHTIALAQLRLPVISTEKQAQKSLESPPIAFPRSSWRGKGPHFHVIIAE